MVFHLQQLKFRPILHACFENAAHNATEFFVFERAVILPFQLLLLRLHEWPFQYFFHRQVQHAHILFENIYAERLTIALFLRLYWQDRAGNRQVDGHFAY